MRKYIRTQVLYGSMFLLLLMFGLVSIQITSAAVEGSQYADQTGSEVSKVEYLALQFATEVTKLELHRGNIALTYSDAIAELNRIETKVGINRRTTSARKIMQDAIGQYMQKNGSETDEQLTNNLHIYSVYLTESLIERAA